MTAPMYLPQLFVKQKLTMMVNAVIIGGTDTTRNQLGCALALFAGDLVIAPKDADVDELAAVGHGWAGQSGRRASRLSSFTFAPSPRKRSTCFILVT